MKYMFIAKSCTPDIQEQLDELLKKKKKLDDERRFLEAIKTEIGKIEPSIDEDGDYIWRGTINVEAKKLAYNYKDDCLTITVRIVA